ncbi:NAD(P)/FAD-dependent oxidoreductase [Microbacterium oxydans]|uniref:NAD(P)/FAD-dependent oxidoreductase n=1 Tax=Microbacterium sp. B19(2022) TaxID=2914045 RepID=UPI0014307183|nr:FAD-dependent oxidoreductase [Microbacterium sp. B19(2022)]NJI59306.1 NAD(P)/FAD-dependent oxidoreductase [Microbacterium sp. B19(2022)]
MNHPLATEIVVVGAGMAAQHFVEQLVQRAGDDVRVTVIGDEGRAPYDRTRLRELFLGGSADDLPLPFAAFENDRVELVLDDRVLHIDRRAKTVRTRSRRLHRYDTLVLATGASAGRVAVEGAGLPGCFSYRTVEDAEALRDFVGARASELERDLRGVVVGGGPIGLEAAGALQAIGVDATVVQYADRLMEAQLDGTAGSIVKRHLQARGIAVRTGTRVTRLDPDESGVVTAIEFQDGSFQRVDVVVFTVGLRARDELARNAGIAVHPYGGIVIDDTCRTSDPSVLAIGEVASLDGRRFGLVAPARDMAEVAVGRVLGHDARFAGFDESAAITLAGVDVASFGDALARTPDAVDVLYADPVAGVYRKLVLAGDAHTLLGGILVGDASAYPALHTLVGARLEADPSSYVLPNRG